MRRLLACGAGAFGARFCGCSVPSAGVRARRAAPAGSALRVRCSSQCGTSTHLEGARCGRARRSEAAAAGNVGLEGGHCVWVFRARKRGVWGLVVGCACSVERCSVRLCVLLVCSVEHRAVRARGRPGNRRAGDQAHDPAQSRSSRRGSRRWARGGLPPRPALALHVGLYLVPPQNINMTGGAGTCPTSPAEHPVPACKAVGWQPCESLDRLRGPVD